MKKVEIDLPVGCIVGIKNREGSVRADMISFAFFVESDWGSRGVGPSGITAVGSTDEGNKVFMEGGENVIMPPCVFVLI